MLLIRVNSVAHLVLNLGYRLVNKATGIRILRLRVKVDLVHLGLSDFWLTGAWTRTRSERDVVLKDIVRVNNQVKVKLWNLHFSVLNHDGHHLLWLVVKRSSSSIDLESLVKRDETTASWVKNIVAAANAPVEFALHEDNLAWGLGLLPTLSCSWFKIKRVKIVFFYVMQDI